MRSSSTMPSVMVSPAKISSNTIIECSDARSEWGPSYEECSGAHAKRCTELLKLEEFRVKKLYQGSHRASTSAQFVRLEYPWARASVC